MCDPLTLGALAVGAAGTAANSIGQAKAAKQQEAEYNSWANYQKKIRGQENVRQEELRGKAAEAQQKGVQDISAEAQTAAQAAEETRLAALLQGEGSVQPSDTATSQAAADEALAGQRQGGEVFQSDLARGLADAAASAKQRIGAMATVQSYGGSWGGLGTRNPLVQQESGRGIDFANAGRQGSLAAYGTERDVDPKQITYSNPIADVASQFLGVGLQGAGSLAAGGAGAGLGGGAFGKGVSSIFSGRVKPKLPTSGMAFGF